jgi:hypothetical protein
MTLLLTVAPGLSRRPAAGLVALHALNQQKARQLQLTRVL